MCYNNYPIAPCILFLSILILTTKLIIILDKSMKVQNLCMRTCFKVTLQGGMSSIAKI